MKGSVIIAQRLPDGWVEYTLNPDQPRQELLVSSVRVRVNPRHAEVRVWNRGGLCATTPLMINVGDVTLFVCRLLDCSPSELGRVQRGLPPIEWEVPVGKL